MVSLHTRRAVVRAGQEFQPLARLVDFSYAIFMGSAISRTRKRGRPATGAISVHLRVGPPELSGLDQWRKDQQEETSRPEAVRRIIAEYLRERGYLAK